MVSCDSGWLITPEPYSFLHYSSANITGLCHFACMLSYESLTYSCSPFYLKTRTAWFKEYQESSQKKSETGFAGLSIMAWIHFQSFNEQVVFETRIECISVILYIHQFPCGQLKHFANWTMSFLPLSSYSTSHTLIYLILYIILQLSFKM